MVALSYSGQLHRVAHVLDANLGDSVRRLRQQLAIAGELCDRILHRFIRTQHRINYTTARNLAESLWGTTSPRFAAIDGSEDRRSLGELVVFTSCAAVVFGRLTFNETPPPEITIDEESMGRGVGVSSIIPLHVSEVAEAETPELSAEEGATRYGLGWSDDAVLSNARISNAIMELAEYFLALDLIRKDPVIRDPRIQRVRPVQILLLDRSPSADIAILRYQVARRRGRVLQLLSNAAMVFAGKAIDTRPSYAGALNGLIFPTSSGEEDWLRPQDVLYGFRRLAGAPLKALPRRYAFINWLAVHLLDTTNQALTPEEITEALGVPPEHRDRYAKRIRNFLQKHAVPEGVVSEVEGDRFKVCDEFRGSWQRLIYATDYIYQRLFAESEAPSPLRFRCRTPSGEEVERWLTRSCIAFVTLITLYRLIAECWQNRVLLIGVVKDTTVRDLQRYLRILAANNRTLSKNDLPLLSQPLPPDRALLQLASLARPERLTPPWVTLEYDAFFRGVVPESDRPDFLRGGIATHQLEYVEGVFVKAYFQLRAAATEPRLRSYVLSYDRLVFHDTDPPELVDQKGLPHQPCKNLVERIHPVMYLPNSPNPYQDLTFYILVALDVPAIPEAFGHNFPLFLADKCVKFWRRKLAGILEGVQHRLLTHPRLGTISFYLQPFRERRHIIERRR